MHINLKQIEQNIKPLSGRASYGKDFIFELLAAYGRSTGNITRLRNGQLNVANDKKSEVAQKGVVYFKPTTDNVYSVIDELQTDPAVVRYSTRFVIVTDFKKLLAFDTKTSEPLDIDITKIDKHFAFFLPWAGMEKAQYASENHADIKAAEKMAKLFDELIAYNKGGDAKYYHGLNVFFMRLLFCYFAEDTDTFTKSQFTSAIASYTQEDGSDVAKFIDELFVSLDVEDKTGSPAYIAAFPYVNGKLFRGSFVIPEFNKNARNLLLECGKLNWSNINPDIFGSMIQAVVNPGQRAGLGMHYTSVPNILKTIEPLFLDELKEEFSNSYNDSKKLEKLLGRIGMIKIFDPACGSGNFLIIAYKELRKLEHAILERQGQLGSTSRQLFSRINIEHFYGIEIDDFAHEVAMLSLWLAKHQMNIEFRQKFGVEIPLIPLKEAGHIVHANAAKKDWGAVCPNNSKDEIYVIGNPPYSGARRQELSHKQDLELCFKDVTNRYKNLDYVAIWFYKAARYIANNPNSAASLVSTNSVTQGQQVELIWPLILSLGVKIDYAYTSFKWSNSAKNNAGISCVIIALSARALKYRFIETDTLRVETKEITPYLKEKTHSNIIPSRSKPISDLPKMEFGNMPLDGGALVLSDKDKIELIDAYPQAKQYVRRLAGAKEYINDLQRWCLWVDDEDFLEAERIPYIKDRIDLTKKFRLASKDTGTQKKALKAYQFREHKHPKVKSLIIPRVSSARRTYIPIGFVGTDTVVSDSAQVIYDPDIYIFGLISSRMHMAWVRATAGQLKTDFRYSSAIVYNNYPVPSITKTAEHAIDENVFKVLDARENHTEMTLAEMYDPDKMPDDLKLAHAELDKVIDGLYSKKSFGGDEDRLACLFKLYEEMTKNERNPK